MRHLSRRVGRRREGARAPAVLPRLPCRVHRHVAGHEPFLPDMLELAPGGGWYPRGNAANDGIRGRRDAVVPWG